jgi:hypothetical protein
MPAGIAISRLWPRGPRARPAYAWAMVARGSRPASVADVHELAMAMPHVMRTEGSQGTPVVYQVGGKSFVFFRNPRPDACDPVTGERYDDVIVFWVADEADKRSLVDDEDSPFFTTPHFDGHLSVLLRGKHVPELSHAELAEVVQDAWLARASRKRAAQWLDAQKLDRPGHATVRDDTDFDLRIFGGVSNPADAVRRDSEPGRPAGERRRR